MNVIVILNIYCFKNINIYLFSCSLNKAQIK